jgi:hypothetical protein
MPAQGGQDQRPGARVEVILRDHDLILLPHVVVRLEQIRDDGTAPALGAGSRRLADGDDRSVGDQAAVGERAAGRPPGCPAVYYRLKY